MPHQRHVRLGWGLLALTVLGFIAAFGAGFRLAGWGFPATFTVGVWLVAGALWGRLGVHSLSSAWVMLALGALLTGLRHLAVITAPLQQIWVGANGAQWCWGAAWILLGAASCQFVRAHLAWPRLVLRFA